MLFLLSIVLQETVATISGTLPGLMAEGDQEEEAEGINKTQLTRMNKTHHIYPYSHHVKM